MSQPRPPATPDAAATPASPPNYEYLGEVPDTGPSSLSPREEHVRQRVRQALRKPPATQHTRRYLLLWSALVSAGLSVEEAESRALDWFPEEIDRPFLSPDAFKGAKVLREMALEGNEQSEAIFRDACTRIEGGEPEHPEVVRAGVLREIRVGEEVRTRRRDLRSSASSAVTRSASRRRCPVTGSAVQVGRQSRSSAGRTRGSRRGSASSASSASGDSSGEAGPPPRWSVPNRLQGLSSFASFADLHELTPSLTGPERLVLFEALPAELQRTIYANLRSSLGGEWS